MLNFQEGEKTLMKSVILLIVSRLLRIELNVYQSLEVCLSEVMPK